MGGGGWLKYTQYQIPDTHGGNLDPGWGGGVTDSGGCVGVGCMLRYPIEGGGEIFPIRNFSLGFACNFFITVRSKSCFLSFE